MSGMSAPTAVSPAEHWTLPAEFTSLLTRPLREVLDELVPVPRAKSEGQKVEKVAKTPFLASLDSIPDANTLNGAPAYADTRNPLLDLFADLAPSCNQSALFAQLDKAWEESPELTLRIIFHARSIHEGKGYKEGFLRAVAWLYEKHPRTLFANLHLVVDPTCERNRSQKRDTAKAARKLAANNGVEVLDEDGNVEETSDPEYPPRPHGSFDDLNDILVLAVNGQLRTDRSKIVVPDGALAPTNLGKEFKRARLLAKEGDKAASKSARSKTFHNVGREGRHERELRMRLRDSEIKDDMSSPNILYALSQCATRAQRTSVLKTRATAALADAKLQALYLTIIDIYAAYLTDDLARLDAHNKYLLLPESRRNEEGFGKPGSSPHLFGMSYAAKWAPTPGKSADKQLHMATALALRLFADRGLDTKTARRRLQAEVLTPLRRVLSVPETRMVKGPWTIDYPKVPSRAMNKHLDSFEEHDKEGLEKYLFSVGSGKSTIAGAAMVPHHLIHDAKFTEGVRRTVAGYQWDSLVDSIRSSSHEQLSNCIAVADVSGSMGFMRQGTAKGHTVAPIWPCIALTLLISELARSPWNGQYITFSSEPTVWHIDPTLPLHERVELLSDADWGMNTNYLGVFEEILRVAKAANLPPDEMVKKVFVFSDMQFDVGFDTSNSGVPAHQAVVDMFQQAGYAVPELIYWDLKANAAKPVQAATPNTSLVSGFSGALMKYFIRSLDDEPEASGEADAVDDEWDDLGKDVEDLTMDDGEAEGSGKKAGKEKKEKKEKNPLDHMMAIIGAAPFNGLVVVD